MIHETGHMGGFVPVGKSHNGNPYPVICTYDPIITGSGESRAGEQKGRGGQRRFFDECTSCIFH
jgi:hypothetical protein